MYDTLTNWLPPPDPAGPVTCAVCGCRLVESDEEGARVWRHFPSLHPAQDARGCRPRCVDASHGSDGYVVAPTPRSLSFLLLDESRDEVLMPEPEEGAAAA